jgi:hypothetical protein
MVMKKFSEILNEKITQAELMDLEKFADRILAKFNIDVSFTKHFVDRVNDDRNNPDITVSELQKLFKKIQDNKGEYIKKMKNVEAVLKDVQSDLNIPVAINFRNGEFEIVNKTIMRKKDFKTHDKTIRYK